MATLGSDIAKHHEEPRMISTDSVGRAGKLPPYGPIPCRNCWHCLEEWVRLLHAHGLRTDRLS